VPPRRSSAVRSSAATCRNAGASPQVRMLSGGTITREPAWPRAGTAVNKRAVRPRALPRPGTRQERSTRLSRHESHRSRQALRPHPRTERAARLPSRTGTPVCSGRFESAEVSADEEAEVPPSWDIRTLMPTSTSKVSRVAVDPTGQERGSKTLGTWDVPSAVVVAVAAMNPVGLAASPCGRPLCCQGGPVGRIHAESTDAARVQRPPGTCGAGEEEGRPRR
jgi:hypothetical protein